MKEFKGIRRALWDKYCALPRFSFLLNRSGGVGRWENKSGGWNDTHEVSQLIESAQDEINEQCDKLAEQAQEIERLTAELEQVKKAQTDHSEQDLEMVGAGGTCWMMPTVKQLERAIGSVPSFYELSAELIAPAMLEHLREVISAGEYGDAYRGARDDLLIWKRRALEAETKVREQDLIIENLGDALNAESGPTFMGEPVVSARGGNDRATLAAPPAIPTSQVLVERELLERVERYFSGFVSDEPPAYALGSNGLATIRAILSRKGGDV